MGAADEVAEQGGCGCLYLGPYLLCGGPFGNVVRFGDMVDDPPHCDCIWGIPPQGGL